MIKNKILKFSLLLFIVILCFPEFAQIPVQGASAKDWNAKSFWYEPWGKSGVHKGIDIFGKINTPILSTSYGVVIFAGEIAMGGKVVAVLGPHWRIYYYAHLNSAAVFIGEPVWSGKFIATLGDTGNAKNKPPHLHYSVVSLLPYIWRADSSTQGWKKMFYLNPNDVLPK
jgi:peptidoglycan LD-endopeptidase LytH